MFKIMVIEDDLALKNQISEELIKWGHNLHPIDNLEDILSEFKSFEPQLLLLDINLPFYDGFYWCNQIRQFSKIPIIFISSRNSNMDVIMGINLGADDYIQKPFSIDVLIAKVNAILRRTYDFNNSNSNIITYNNITLDLSTATLSHNDTSIELSKNEFKILTILLNNKGQIISRDKLMQKLWDNDWFVDDNTLTVNINRLRKRLSQIGLDEFIITKRGMGYLIN